MLKNYEENKKDKEIELIYQVTIDDIQHNKNQQWLITYYVLLLQSAIIGLYKMIVKENLPVDIKLAQIIIHEGSIALLFLAIILESGYFNNYPSHF